MDFNNVLESRKSIRKFQPTEISEEIVREILSLAQLAPSAGNLQAYKVKIVRTKDKRELLKEATFTRNFTKQESIMSAPVIFVICADPAESETVFKERGKLLYALQDATILAAYLQLVIASKGLASVWIGSFNEDEVKKALALHNNLRPLIMIPFGFPGGESRPRERKKLEEIII
ncbi:MAG: nitroreductase family protein [Patescibacteria group bacterium]